jgi:hypothetical protein
VSDAVEVDEHVLRAQPPRQLVAVLLAGEHDVDGRLARLAVRDRAPGQDRFGQLGVQAPDLVGVEVHRVVVEVADDPHAGGGRVGLGQPAHPVFEGDLLRGGREDRDGRAFAARGRRLDQVVVPVVRWVELAEHQRVFELLHARTRSLVQLRSPITHSTMNPTYNTAVRYSSLYA